MCAPDVVYTWFTEITVSFDQLSYTVEEGMTVIISFVSEGSLQRPVNISVEHIDASAFEDGRV